MWLYYNLPIYKETYDFILQVFHITRDFWREYKYTLGQDMKKEAISLVRNIYRANRNYNKKEYLLIFVIFGLDPNIQKKLIDLTYWIPISSMGMTKREKLARIFYFIWVKKRAINNPSSQLDFSSSKRWI